VEGADICTAYLRPNVGKGSQVSLEGLCHVCEKLRHVTVSHQGSLPLIEIWLLSLTSPVTVMLTRFVRFDIVCILNVGSTTS
jgi:hypothetical protein